MRSQIYESNHLVEIFSKLNKERKSTTNYCDVALTAEGHDFQTHKCILAAFSLFYNKLFSTEMKEKYENKANIQGVSPETMETVLNFVYTCNVEITSENVYDLLEASNYMEIPNLKMYCCEFLLGEINATNCLRMRAYSKLYNLEKLTTKADGLIAEEFQSVISEKEFLELNFDEVAELMQLEEKKTSSEEIVYYALIGWMKHDITARKTCVVELFRLLKLEEVSWGFVENTILKEDLIMNSLECMKMALQSTVSRITIEQTNSIATVQEEIKFIGFSKQKVWKFDVMKKQVTRMPDTKYNHTFGSAIYHKKSVVVITGEQNKVEKINLKNERAGWVELSPPNVDRWGAASVVCNGSIATVGGGSAWLNPLPSGESFNIDENRWSPIASMNRGRCHHCLVLSRELVYAIGGQDRNCTSNTVECFDPRKSRWKPFPSMNFARRAFAAVVHNEEIYAIGGVGDNNIRLNSVEKYDQLSQTWRNVAPMNEARIRPGRCVRNGKIYVAGGGTDTIEVYDVAANVWEVKETIPGLEKAFFMVEI